MDDSARLVFQLLFGCMFLATLIAGIYLLKNDRRLFGPHPDQPSETIGGRSYNRAQIWLVWAHAAFLSGAMALAFH